MDTITGRCARCGTPIDLPKGDPYNRNLEVCGPCEKAVAAEVAEERPERGGN